MRAGAGKDCEQAMNEEPVKLRILREIDRVEGVVVAQGDELKRVQLTQAEREGKAFWYGAAFGWIVTSIVYFSIGLLF